MSVVSFSLVLFPGLQKQTLVLATSEWELLHKIHISISKCLGQDTNHYWTSRLLHSDGIKRLKFHAELPQVLVLGCHTCMTRVLFRFHASKTALLGGWHEQMQHYCALHSV